MDVDPTSARSQQVAAKAAALAKAIVNSREPAAWPPGMPPPGCNADQALQHEGAHLAKLRESDSLPRGVDSKGRAIGLALSGGGIRSATFSLGVLQALSEARLMRNFDYLSTVSGGGYIGSWWSSILQGRHQASVDDPIGETERVLWPGGQMEPSQEAPEISFLRSYSNYLTPQLGLFSADTLAAFSGYLRNLALSLLLALSSVGMLIAMLHAVAVGMTALAGPWKAYLPVFTRAAQVALLLAVGLAALLLTLQSLDPRNRLAPGKMRVPMLEAIQRLHSGVGRAMLPMAAVGLLLAGVVLESVRPSTTSLGEVLEFSAMCLVAMVIGALLAYMLLDLYNEWNPSSWDELVRSKSLWLNLYNMFDWQTRLIRMLAEGWRETLRYPVAVLACALAATGLLAWNSTLEQATPLVGLFRGPLMCGLVVTVLTVVWLGAVGTLYAEPSREWLSRLLGGVVGLMLAWGATGLLVVESRPLLLWLVDGKWVALLPAAGVLPTVALVILLLLRQKGAATPAAPSGAAARSIRLLVLAASALVALLFLAILVMLFQEGLLAISGYPTSSSDSWATARNEHRLAMMILLQLPAGALPVPTVDLGPGAAALESAVGNLAWQEWTDWAVRLWKWAPWLSLLVGAVLMVVIGFEVIDVNVFSLQNLYRNRLVRCYLGASRHASRMQNPYAGFDPADDLPMAALSRQRPLHLMNAALNITHGDDLALQQRKAASFCFSPLFCGYWLGASNFGRRGPQGGYVATSRYAYEPASAGSDSSGVMVGTAMATSGAAVSPQMGFASSGLLAFVLTLFNVRLGRWLPNTTTRQRLDLLARHSPSNAGSWYLQELLGRTNEKSDWVYLSDGGHFDNLGVYELVRRRCSLIVVVDAGADPAMEFGDLGNCVRKCRVDFAVDISIDPQAFGWDATRRICSTSHVLGRVQYPSKGDEPGFVGHLLYLKASLPTIGGALPADVTTFAAADRLFPHQSTADQWFTEAQFESYRQLGQWIGRLALPTLNKVLGRSTISDLPGEFQPPEVAR